MKFLIILDFQLFGNNLGDMGGLGSKHPKKKKFSIQEASEGEGRVKSLPSSSLKRILLSNQDAALHGDSISARWLSLGYHIIRRQAVAWLVDLGVDAGTTSLLCVGGRQEGQGVWRLHRNTLARAHLFTQSARQPATHLGRQRGKRSNILQEDSTLPGGWGIIPLHRVGGVGGGRNTRVRGLCLRSRVPLFTHRYTHTRVCAHTHTEIYI